MSKSYALAIIENEQLRKTARVAQHSAQVLHQQSRHDQAEMHKLQKELEQALQLKASAEPAASMEDSKQTPEQEPAAAQRKAQRVQRACNTCLPQATEAAHQPLQNRDAATQADACAVQLLLDEQQAASDPEQEATGVMQPEGPDGDVHHALSLLHRIAPLQSQLDAVRSELLAIQQAAQHDKNCIHASVPVQRMLRETPAMLESMSVLHDDMKAAVHSLPKLKQPAKIVKGSQSMQVDLEHSKQIAVHKRQQYDDCESTGKRQKLQSDAPT